MVPFPGRLPPGRRNQFGTILEKRIGPTFAVRRRSEVGTRLGNREMSLARIAGRAGAILVVEVKEAMGLLSSYVDDRGRLRLPSDFRQTIEAHPEWFLVPDDEWAFRRSR